MMPSPEDRPDWPDEAATLPGFDLGHRAIVAERDTCLRRRIARWLATEGLFVTEVNDVEELLQIAAEIAAYSMEALGLIVVDASLPEVGGIELLERIRQAENHTTTILIACTRQDGNAEQTGIRYTERLATFFYSESLLALANRLRCAYDTARSPTVCPF